MLTPPTVFVLGAGASVPFNFPTGAGLAQRVADLGVNDPFLESMNAAGYQSDDIFRLRDAFRYSGNPSIDAFLEHRTDLIDTGRAVIAALLIGCEAPDAPFAFSDQNWLRYLFARLNTAPERFGENKISFVTFNYDRSLEHFLFEALKHSHNLTDNEAARLVSTIEIIHLHGRLGFLPWQSRDGRAYNQMIDKTAIATCVNHIKIVHEDPSDGRDQDFARAKELLKDAAQVRFLGFGYNPVNLRRIGVADLPPKDIRGSGLGMTQPEASDVKKHGPIEVHIDKDCIGLLRNYMVWD